MNVYLLEVQHTPNSEPEVLGVYSSREKAVALLPDVLAHWGRGNPVYLSTFALDRMFSTASLMIDSVIGSETLHHGE